MAVLKQVGTLSCDSDTFKMSVMTSTSWLAHALRTRPGMLSSPASLLIFTLSRILLTSALDSDRLVFWRQSRLDSWFFVEEIKVSTKCVKLIWQHGLIHDGRCSCFCSLWWSGLITTYIWWCWCWGLSPVSPDVSALLPWCQLSVTLWWCCMLPCHLTERQLCWLWIGPHLSIHPGFLVGEWFYCLCDHHIIKTFLICIPKVDVVLHLWTCVSLCTYNNPVELL